MIGYGIPRTVERYTHYDGNDSEDDYDEKIFYEWERGYLWETDEDIPAEPRNDEQAPSLLRWNDFYLNIRAKKIQRWFRSFEELPMACPCPE